MAYRVGRTHYVDFKVIDISNNPVTTLILSDFTIYFTRDGIACTDPLTFINVGGGRYRITYSPTGAGFYFLDIYNFVNDVRVIDSEEIDTPETFFDEHATVDLTQDFGGVGRLKPTISSPDTYTLYVFQSQRWQTGLNDPGYADASTNLDSLGNWITTPLTVMHGTYHIVLLNGGGDVLVIAAFLVA